MTDRVAHHGLRFLIRASGTPEVTTNDLLQALLDADPGMRVAFLQSLSALTGRDLRTCRIEREAYTVDATSGKKSYRDFRLSLPGETRCIVETKVDSALTSADQASRYFAQLSDDGALVLVTRAALARALAAQTGQQLDVSLQESNGIHKGVKDQRTVLVTSWTRLLRGVIAADGTTFDELLALDAALEGISDFVPFTAAVQDVASGQMVRQIVRIADQLCGRLRERLETARVTVDSVSGVRSGSKEVYVKVIVLNHEFWVGYNTNFWARVPGDPGDAKSGAPTAAAPSPFWISCFTGPPMKAEADLVQERRQRLNSLGITKPLRVALGAPEDAVIDLLLNEAVAHIRMISEGLHADPRAVRASGLPASEEEISSIVPEDSTEVGAAGR